MGIYGLGLKFSTDRSRGVVSTNSPFSAIVSCFASYAISEDPLSSRDSSSGRLMGCHGKRQESSVPLPMTEVLPVTRKLSLDPTLYQVKLWNQKVESGKIMEPESRIYARRGGCARIKKRPPWLSSEYYLQNVIFSTYQTEILSWSFFMM